MTDEMTDLIKRARKESKWLHSSVFNLWLSPDEARQQLPDLSDINPDDWTLRNPHDRLEQLREYVVAAQAKVTCFEQRMRGES